MTKASLHDLLNRAARNGFSFEKELLYETEQLKMHKIAKDLFGKNLKGNYMAEIKAPLNSPYKIALKKGDL